MANVRFSGKCKQLMGVLSFCLLGWSQMVYADFTAAMVNYDAKKFPEAMEEFKRLASLGHKESQMNLGVMYFRGEGLEKNPVEAYAWLALASSDGNLERAHTRDLVMKKLDVKQKELAFKRADELLNTMSEAALKDKLTPVLLADVDCQFQLKALKMNPPRYPDEMIHLGKSGSVDVDFSIDKLGFVKDYSIIVSTNEGFNKEVLNALKKWRFEPTLVNGEPVDVVVKQARMQFHIQGAMWDKEKIKAYLTELRTKADTGTTNDMYSFAYITNLIPELKVEKQESNSWFLKAAQAGLPQAQYEIGKSLFRGEGCATDTKKGVEWLTLAAQKNSPDAQYFLGASLLGSKDFQQNKKQAVDWLSHAALGKHAKAAMRLSWILATDSDELYRNPSKSLSLVTEVYDAYPDKFRANENLAAAQAANSLFDDAIKSQELAIKFAKQIDYPLTELNKRLDTYKQHQPWREKI